MVVSRAGSWRPQVARDVRHDVHAGTPALKALRMIVSFAATRDGRHRPRSLLFYDSVAAFVRASKDEFMGVVPPEGKGVFLAVEGVLWHSDGFETVAAVHESAQEAWVKFEQGDAWTLSPPRPCWNVWMSRTRLHGSDALLDRLDRVMPDDAKMLDV